MTDKNDDSDENDYQSDEDSEQISLKSTNSFAPNVQDNEENLRRTPSSLNSYSILPPIKSANDDNQGEQTYFIKHLQDKYQQPNDPNEMTNDDKLNDAYLKMKRLDKALEEAFEKEKQVKFETISLMKQLRNEMQSMTVALNVDSNETSQTQSNFKRFLALDDEILKLDGYTIEDDHSNPTESIFKTQLNDPLADSNSTTKTDKESSNNSRKNSFTNQKKKASLTSNNTKDSVKTKSKLPGKDFIKRNIQLAKELGGTYALTDDERQRLNQLLNEDEPDNAIVLANEQFNGYLPSINDNQRLKEIDDLLEKEYYNPFLNHQLRRNNQNDMDYLNLQQITNEENEQIDNYFGEKILKETRLQREHMLRLRHIDEQLERLRQPITEEKCEAILSDEQLNELLGQCAVDEMKQRYSFLHRDKQDQQEIDFNDLSNYTLTHYVDHNQGPLITDDIIQLLINEAQQEGIVMRKFNDETEENEMEDFQQQQQTEPLSIAPVLDRPLSSTSTASHC